MFHRQLVGVVAGCALIFVDPGRRDKGERRAEIVEKGVHTHRRKERIVGMKLPAAQDNVTGRFLFQSQKRVHGAADGGKRERVGEGINDIGQGGATVKKDRVVLADQAGGHLSQPLLSGGVLPVLVADKIVTGMTFGIADDIAAQQHYAGARLGQIAANRHLRDAQQPGRIFQMEFIGAFERLRQFLDAFIAPGFHGHLSVPYPAVRRKDAGIGVDTRQTSQI